MDADGRTQIGLVTVLGRHSETGYGTYIDPVSMGTADPDQKKWIS